MDGQGWLKDESKQNDGRFFYLQVKRTKLDTPFDQDAYSRARISTLDLLKREYPTLLPVLLY
jgi:hypothetical protein